jgi:tRNA threonylcarbamoyladenosine biosynthesis protein TsaE
LHWSDETRCAAYAQALAQRPALRLAYVELDGDLGVGKTTFVRHLLRALGVPGRIKSPTYTVVETYALPGLTVAHFDFYRFTDPREWVDAGFRDLFAAPGLKLVEWPLQVAGMLPRPDLRLQIGLGPEPDGGLQGGSREVLLQACTPLGLELMA